MMKFHVHNKRKPAIAAVVGMIALAVIGCLAGTLHAKYFAKSDQKAQTIPTNFHISSDYLQENGNNPTYQVTDWADQDDYQISFKIYNYEKENVALVSSDPIEYQIEATGWNVTVKDINGVDVQPVNSVYTLPLDDSEDQGKNEHTVYLKRIEDTATTASVSVETNAPFKTVLTATFTLQERSDFEYAITDHTNYVIVVINTNHYHGNLAVAWGEDFSPDNTNPLMKHWNNISRRGVLQVTEHATYELIFFKNNLNAKTDSIIITNGGES